MSQTMIIDVDPGKRSSHGERALLHHDLIQNPATAFHFEINWIGTTAGFLHDLIQRWSQAIDMYGLKLVEGYVDQIMNIQSKNVFQCCFPIRLAIPPPVIPNLAKHLPEGVKAPLYFEHAILREFGYILDIEAGDRYPETIEVVYSYRRTPFTHSQFVHQSGIAFVQVIGGQEGFRWITNRLYVASTSSQIAGGQAMQKQDPPAWNNIRLDLYNFCSDAAKLEAFYDKLTRSLRPEFA